MTENYVSSWAEIEKLAGDCESGSHFSPGASEEEVAAYEHELGFAFSPMLREWILLHHHALVGPRGIMAVDHLSC